jgi:hypothetical protein
MDDGLLFLDLVMEELPTTRAETHFPFPRAARSRSDTCAAMSPQTGGVILLHQRYELSWLRK